MRVIHLYFSIYRTKYAKPCQYGLAKINIFAIFLCFSRSILVQSRIFFDLGYPQLPYFHKPQGNLLHWLPSQYNPVPSLSILQSKTFCRQNHKAVYMPCLPLYRCLQGSSRNNGPAAASKSALLQLYLNMVNYFILE